MDVVLITYNENAENMYICAATSRIRKLHIYLRIACTPSGTLFCNWDLTNCAIQSGVYVCGGGIWYIYSLLRLHIFESTKDG